MVHVQACPDPQPDYNTRLFSGGVRMRLHLARFLWLRDTLDRLNLKPNSVFEIGCFDGRAVEFLPRVPDEYLGLDAGWEDAIALAHQRWAAQPHLSFRESQTPAQMKAAIAGRQFDLTLALETLEHLAPADLDDYLAQIAAATKGVFLATIPVETGPVFAAKHILKMLLIGNPEEYGPREFVFQTLGMTDRVVRRDHKGFSHARMIESLQNHFIVERVEGIPFRFVPPLFNFGVAVICRPKTEAINGK